MCGLWAADAERVVGMWAGWAARRGIYQEVEGVWEMSRGWGERLEGVDLVNWWCWEEFVELDEEQGQQEGFTGEDPVDRDVMNEDLLSEHGT